MVIIKTRRVKMYNGKMRIAIILVLINFVALSACVIDPETGISNGLIIAVDNGSAPPGAEAVSVNVSMDNVDPVKGIQMDICDEGDYLTCTGCELSGRVSDFECITNELDHGCVRLVLISLEGDLIDVGTGPLFSLSYDVADGAPSECVNLTPEGTKVSDENTNPLIATTEEGEFCIN
jgi:hypothetical protein